MKKFLAIVLFAAMIFALAIPVMADHQIAITAPKGTPVLDGVKDDVYSDWVAIGYAEQPDGATGKIAVAWDDNNIYCIVEVYDTTPFHDNGTNWMTDNVEIFFDWNNHKADTEITNDDEPFWQVRIHSAPGENGFNKTGHNNNQWSNTDADDEGHLFEDIKFVIVGINGKADLSDGYIIEASFPKEVALSEGKVLGFDATISDAHDDDERYSTGFFFNADDYDMPNDMWTNPSALKALLTLGAAPAAGGNDNAGGDEEVGGGDVVVDVVPAKTGDSAIMLFVLVAMAGAVVFTKRAKNRA